MKPRRSWWLIFGAAALAVVVALLYVTTEVLRLERQEIAARAEARYQEALRLALWRMDSWFAPRLAREAARPYFEYLSYYPQERAYTRILNVIEKGEVLTPSPLLTFTSDFFTIHFQLNADGTLTSPQLPTGSQRDLAQATLLAGAAIDARQAALDQLRPMLDRDRLAARLQQAEIQLVAMTCDAANMTEVPELAQADSQQVLQSGAAAQQAQTLWTQREQARRVEGNIYAQTMEPQSAQQSGDPVVDKKASNSKAADQDFELALAEAPVTIGPLVAIWAGSPMAGAGGAASELLFVRRVHAGGQEFFQGFRTDWPHLRSTLLDQIKELFQEAALVRTDAQTSGAAETGRMLATIPVSLEATAAGASGPGGSPRAGAATLTPVRATLALTWLAVLAAIAAAAVTLRASIVYGEKRARFASAVTHELRTPLTTFRMYSEMLARGMVRDEDQRQSYLETLTSESSRLSALVENVLSYARLEEGRSASHVQPTTVAKLLARLAPPLQRRAQSAGMTLVIQDHTYGDDDADGDANGCGGGLEIDVEAVGQILFNLVDNACKYAGAASGERDSAAMEIHVDVQIENGNLLSIRVRDHGPGVPVKHAHAIFQPFDRGPRKPGDTIPGVGLGLALARGLAREMGGDLLLEPPLLEPPLPPQQRHAPGINPPHRSGPVMESDGAQFRLVLPARRRGHGHSGA